MRLVSVLAFALTVPVYASLESFHLTGEVLLQNNGPRTVLAFVQPDDRGVAHILRVTAEEPFPQNPLSLHLSSAEIAVRPDRIVIVSRAQKIKVILALNEERPSRERPEELAGRYSGAPTVRQEIEESGELHVVLLRGYWLSSKVVEPGRSIASLRRPAAVAAEWCDASVSGDACLNDDDGGSGSGSGGGTVTCDSGGRGSTQCSCSAGSTSCSVTCGSGYYACCTGCHVVGGPNCNCLRN